MIHYCKLIQKEVVNVLDGKRLGYICDLVLDICEGRICAIVVPGCSKFTSFFRPARNFVIPWKQICKIGEDVILVEIDCSCSMPPPHGEEY